jgi:hypothetical protein
MRTPRRLLAALVCSLLTTLPDPAAHAALPLRSRGDTLPAAPNSSMANPLPTPPPPPQLPPDAYGRFHQGLSAEVVRRVIWVHINQIRYCYQQALFKQPTLAGRLVMNFQINPEGQVLDLMVRETTLQSPQLLSCITETMRTWEFPRTPSYAGIIEINYPFLLRPRVPEPAVGIEVSDAELEQLGIFKDPEPPPVDILF